MAGHQGHKLSCICEGGDLSFVGVSGLLVSSVMNINCVGFLTVKWRSDMEGYDRILFEVSEREGQTGFLVQTRQVGGVKPVQITGAQQPGRGPTAQLCCIIFCPSSSCHYLPTVQINPFTASPSHSATDSQSFRCSVNIFSLSSHAGEAPKKKKNFTRAQTGSRRPCILPLWHPRQYMCTAFPRSVCACTLSPFLYFYCQSICHCVYSQSISIYYAPSPAVLLPFSCSVAHIPYAVGRRCLMSVRRLWCQSTGCDVVWQSSPKPFLQFSWSLL